MDLPFLTLRVVDLSSVLAGPMVGSFFAELGAEVFKIENALGGGDVTRKWRRPGESNDNAISAYYASANTSKKVRQLNLKKDEAREEVYELIRGADVVVTNFQESVAEKLGMAKTILRSLNPKLIVAEIYGYPDATRPAYDAVLQAETGFISMCGTSGGELVKMPVALIDIIAAHHLKEGILTAIINRYETGVGSTVRVSLYDAAIASLANQASNYLMLNEVAGPKGLCHPNICPYGDSFLCADGKQILLAVGSDAQFASLCKLLGVEALASDKRFALNQQRVLNRDALQQAFKDLFLSKNLSDWLELLEKENIPAGAIKDLAEVFASPSAQRLIVEEEIEGVLARKVKTVVFEIQD